MYSIIVLRNILLLISVCVNISKEQVSKATRYELSNFTVLGQASGHVVQEYDVVTEDGYILTLFNIPGDRKRPVLLMHGVVDSADTFMIRRKGSLSITLADQGYDVWAGNFRGNRYSRRHVSLNPDMDKEFWNFTFHEIGYYDLPSIIDFVLRKTGQQKLSTVGHSLGNTIFYVLGSTKPEYNDKVKVMIAISPICSFEYVKPSTQTLITLSPIFDAIMISLGQEEIFGEGSTLKTLTKSICNLKDIGYTVCANGIIFPFAGNDPDELEPEFFPIVAAHYPSGTSRKNVAHLSQIATHKRFSQYDYGPLKNMEVYRTVSPAKYNLNKVKMRVALLFGENDSVASVEDVMVLRGKLPNVVEYRKIAHEKFNHADGVWGRNMKTYLFPNIFEILEKYN